MQMLSTAGLACLALLAWTGAQANYLRDPALHGDTVVFTAEGDLWRASVQGGQAVRLTTHAAEESQAAISPDGTLLAFLASYDSVPEVYVMPMHGGIPRRLSFDGARVSVQGWTPEGEVLYSTENLSGPSWRRVLRAVHPDTRALRELPLADANEAAFDAGGTVWFTRFGLHVTGDHARDYRGGAMAQLWRWTPGEVEAQRVAADAGTGMRHPMWWQGRLYFVADSGLAQGRTSSEHPAPALPASDRSTEDGPARDGTLDGRAANLWSMRPDGSDRRALTSHGALEVRHPALSQGRIAYQLGAELRILDLASGTDQALQVQLPSDRDQLRVRWLQEPLQYLTSAQFGADGQRVALTARGRIALAGVGELRRVEIDTPASSRARHAVLSADGRWVYAISDAGGDNELWRWPADGSGAGEALTDSGDVHRWQVSVSPAGTHLVHDDKRGRLWLLDLRSRRNTLVDDAGRRGAGDDAFSGISWSGDGRTLAFVRPGGPRQINQVVLHDVRAGTSAVLTSDRYESFDPAFSPDGKWLYFLSNRNFQATPGAPWGDRNMGPMFDRRARVYAIALQPGLRFPFLALDELSPAPAHGDDAASQQGASGQNAQRKRREGDARQGDARDGNVSGAAGDVHLPDVAWDGLASRLYEVPLEPGNYSSLVVAPERLYLLERSSAPDARPRLMMVPIAPGAAQAESFMADVQAFALSAARDRLWFMKAAEQGAGDMYIVPAAATAPPPPELERAKVRVGDWKLAVSPAEEWRQMFVDAWRMHRDFAFDPTLRGQDWAAVRARYEPLLQSVSDRNDLDDLLGQMIAELGILHSQVRGGDARRDAEAAAPAALGALFEGEPGKRGVRIARIWHSDPELPAERAPLARPGVDAREGDRLLAINGRRVDAAADVAVALHNQSGQQVLLELERKGATHRTVAVPVDAAADAALRYGDWVQRSRETVEQAAGGRIGYLHLRAMGASDVASFAREFYAQFDREGLIIDVRRNRGGNIDSWIIEKLLRRAWAYWRTDASSPYWNMQQAFRGHLVVLIDNLTYSDGETFAAGIKALQLAPLIGQRTAGAGIWLSDRNRLADNGIARVAEYGQYGLDGRWLIEGLGVHPDIAVDNPPHATWRGADAQLEAAIANLQQRMAEQPLGPLSPQPIPPRGEPGRDVIDPVVDPGRIEQPAPADDPATDPATGPVARTTTLH